MQHLWSCLVLTATWLALAGVGPLAAQPADYSRAENWLCRPGGDDACAVDLSTTIVEADGSLRVEEFAADPEAPIDCFYVYPTVSTDPGGNSDLVIDEAERQVIRLQFLRRSSSAAPRFAAAGRRRQGHR